MLADGQVQEILIGIHQVGFDGADTEDKIQVRTAQMIARSLNVRNTIAFVGSGISRAYGYYDWDSYAGLLAKYTLEHLPREERYEQHFRILESFRDSMLGAEYGATVSSLGRSDRTLVVLDLCDELFATLAPEEQDEYRMFTANEIKKKQSETYLHDPLKLIIEKLEIKRFLTTNYDMEIEDALYRVLGCEVEETLRAKTKERSEAADIRLIARSLVHSPENIEDLTHFAVSAPGYECGVFHLHGIMGDRKSMVVTERDYQRIYLQEDRDHRAFREALRIAFAGNAILFMGTGMEEADLLRPLREFVSEETRGGYERPLFALLPDKYSTNPAERVEFRHYLYSRYGVKALFYPVADEKGNYTEDFCKAINTLAGDWSNWWKGWQKKPLVRKPKFHVIDGKKMVRHLTEPVSSFNVEKDRDKVVKALEKDAAVLVLGRPGSGKGSLGQEIATDDALTSQYEKRFFATAHFSNDFLCMIEAATAFFDDENDPIGRAPGLNPIKRFELVFNKKPHLLVIGGIERLMVPVPLNTAIQVKGSMRFDYPLPVGKAITKEVEQFFAFIRKHIKNLVDTKSHARIVLTSSVLPAALDKDIATVKLEGVEKETIVEHPRFKELRDPELLKELHRALRGHAYALAVVSEALDAFHERAVAVEERKRWLQRVVNRLTSVDLNARATIAIEMASRVLLDTSSRGGLSLDGVLQRVAMFTTPVTPAAVQASYSGKRPTVADVQGALEYLQKRNLLIKVYYEHPPEWRTTAHTIVRHHVLKRMGSFPSAPGEAHRFELAGWSSEAPDTLSGRGQGHALSVLSIDSLLEQLESEPLESQDKPEIREQRRHLIRAVFGLMRSRWTATAIPRLHVMEPEPTLRLPRPHYDSYQRRLARLLNVIRNTATGKPITPPRVQSWISELDDSAHEKAVLYADELAWLYNELGLVALSMGFLTDAYALFRAGQHINAVCERGYRGHRWCESEINLGLVQIERGHLVRGRYHLESAVRASHKLNDNILRARARGHLGLVHHLMGNYARSETLYGEAIRPLRDAGHYRGVSIFLKHRGDLRRKMNKFVEASKDLQQSIAAAESGRHPDLVHYAVIAKANLRRSENMAVALEELSPAIDFARRVGIPKLEWDAKIVQGQIALDQGEFEMAGHLAVSTLGIASSLGLRLRLTGSLILLGRVTEARGHRRGASKLYHAAMELAERQGNTLLIEKAEEAIGASRSTERRRSRHRDEDNHVKVETDLR